jgi:serine/threonine protein kinase
MGMTQPRPEPAADLFREAYEHARQQAEPPAGLPKTAELQALFPEFHVTGLIGRGGMGAVYQAYDPRLDRHVALKVLPPHLHHDPTFAERFARECRTLARLQHPHILTVHDFGERNGLPYLVTEFVDGLDLRRLMRAEKLDPSEALRIVRQVCDALQYAHEQGVVHRDIKPENVLIDTRGHVKVVDFGLAKLVGAPASSLPLTATHQAPGTPHYTAPEALRGLDVDHRADIYALGVLIYELLTGQLPLGHFRAPSERAGTDRRLDAVVARALRDEPEDRYQRVSDFRSDLERPPAAVIPPAVLSGSSATATTGVERAPRSSAGKWLGCGCLVLALLILSALFMSYWMIGVPVPPDSMSPAGRSGVTPCQLELRERVADGTGEPFRVENGTVDLGPPRTFAIARVERTTDLRGLPSIVVEFEPSDSVAFEAWSETLIDKQLGIVLDGRLLSLPTVASRVSLLTIEGGSKGLFEHEIDALVACLRATIR